jgi:His-Xaa-Ser system radical SAM maturase HxsC
MKIAQGSPLRLTRRTMARVSHRGPRASLSRDTVLVALDGASGALGHAALITAAAAADVSPSRVPCIADVPLDAVESLRDGDVVILDPDGSLHRVWRAGSAHNVVMVTNTCNCQCIMCPQPSCSDRDDHEAMNLRMLSLVTDRHVPSIGLTGGEPTLRPDHLTALLALCARRFPQAAIYLLTNGRALANFAITRQIASVRHPRLTYCVPLHADVARLHDDIAGAGGSFAETVRGLHHLARLQQRVEIRVVILRDNYRRLPSLAEFICRNFPFASHIALMGMETTGLAWSNLDAVWVDPLDYTTELHAAVRHLHQRALDVSLYNLPLCVLPGPLWPFAFDSISDWKKVYLPLCTACSVQPRCPGLFRTSLKHSRGLRPLEPVAVAR